MRSNRDKNQNEKIDRRKKSEALEFQNEGRRKDGDTGRGDEF